MSRPSIKSEAVVAQILDGIERGLSLRTVAHKSGPAVSTIKRWLNEDPDFQAQYARACEIRSDYYAERVASVARKVETGKLDSDRGRVAMDGYKWTASRLNPKKWGETRDIVQVNTQVNATSEGPMIFNVPAPRTIGEI